MEKFFLGRTFAANKLHIINHQNIDVAKHFLKINSVLLFQGTDKAIHELFRRQVNHRALGVLLRNMQGNGVHQMGFAKTNATVQKQGIKRN